MNDVRDDQLTSEENWESDSTSQRISPFIIGSIVVLLLLILVLAGLIVRAVFTPQQGPRSEVERNLLKAQANVRALPNDPFAQYDLGIVYKQMGEMDQAEDRFIQAIKLGPEFSDPHYQLGLLYSQQGREEDAISELSEASQLNPKNAQASFELGKIYYENGDWEQAKEQFLNATSASPIFADPHYYLGLAYEQLEELDLAADEFKAALQYIPDHEEARDGLSRVSPE